MNTPEPLTWDPTQYLRFAAQRLRPARDLLRCIPLESPGEVIDLGCGAGNVTELICKRWPDARVLGIDRSEAMLERAARAAPAARFRRDDIARFVPKGQPELVYSNAALQWLPDHSHLLPRLLSLLVPGGFLALQMPIMGAEPFRTLQREIAKHGPWAAALEGISPLHSVLTPEVYWDLLAPQTASLEIWETTYLHALQGPDPVFEWTKGTSLRPYLDALDEPLRGAFALAYKSALRESYPARRDGTTLLPFHRLFILAGKST